MSADSTKKTLQVALGVCVVCAVLVASATVSLSSIQEENKQLDRVNNILTAGNLYDETKSSKAIYEEKITPAIINLETGDVLPKSEYKGMLTPENYDMKKAASDPELSMEILKENDIADIRRKPKYMLIYEVMDGKNVDKYILPIYGKGLWSTLYGFIALDKDLRTIKGITFYEHGETPGLGGEVDNPKWKKQWDGKLVFDENGKLSIEVIKGKVEQDDPNAKYKVDGLSGSTLTTRGVSNLVRFWLGENGYGVFFAKLEKGAAHE